MAKIHLLDERTANQIAAGEVVERPASTVKELVENALDAGAKRIVVEVEGGGRSLIRVTDDGSGMSPADAMLALQRHATSKIASAADLLRVTTMGFRGEAIPSIASVSRFELITREEGALAGTRIYVEGGQLVESGEHGCPTGTRIEIRDLFYNTPARLKYLKTNATEMGQIADTLTRLALANPHVAIRFHSGSTQVFATPGTGELLDTAVALLGRELGRELLPVDYGDVSSRVWGFVGRPGAARASRNHQYVFVNRRPIRPLPVRYALEEAYTNLLPNGRFPVAILFLEVEPEQVDVNVHPTKAEVRFEREREVRAAVYRAARQALGQHLLVPGTTGQPAAPDHPGSGPPGPSGASLATPEGNATPAAASPTGSGHRGWLPPGAARVGQGGATSSQPPWQQRLPVDGAVPVGEGAPAYAMPDGGLRGLLERRALEGAPEPVGDAPLFEPTAVAPEATLIRSLRPLGQIHRTYIVCDGPEGLYAIDQHAAHERIFYERFLHAAQTGEAPVQPLLFPITLDLTPAQMTAWQEHAAYFAESGFQAQPFGGTTLLIHAVPAGVSDAHVARLVTDFLDKLLDERVTTESPLERRQRAIAAMAACKAAIKAKDALQPEDVQALLHDLSGCDSPTTCPHGRPTIICLSIRELEKRFKR